MPTTGFKSACTEQFYRPSRRLGIPVPEAYARAEGYNWRRQDTRSELGDTAQATTFATAYAPLFVESLTREGGAVHTVGGAWRESGGLTVAAGRATP